MNELLAATYSVPAVLFIAVIVALLWWALSGTKEEVAAATDDSKSVVSRGMGCGTVIMGIVLAIAILAVAAEVVMP